MSSSARRTASAKKRVKEAQSEQHENGSDGSHEQANGTMEHQNDEEMNGVDAQEQRNASILQEAGAAAASAAQAAKRVKFEPNSRSVNDNHFFAKYGERKLPGLQVKSAWMPNLYAPNVIRQLKTAKYHLRLKEDQLTEQEKEEKLNEKTFDTYEEAVAQLGTTRATINRYRKVLFNGQECYEMQVDVWPRETLKENEPVCTILINREQLKDVRRCIWVMQINSNDAPPFVRNTHEQQPNKTFKRAAKVQRLAPFLKIKRSTAVKDEWLFRDYRSVLDEATKQARHEQEVEHVRQKSAAVLRATGSAAADANETSEDLQERLEKRRQRQEQAMKRRERKEQEKQEKDLSVQVLQKIHESIEAFRNELVQVKKKLSTIDTLVDCVDTLNDKVEILGRDVGSKSTTTTTTVSETSTQRLLRLKAQQDREQQEYFQGEEEEDAVEMVVSSKKRKQSATAAAAASSRKKKK